MFDNNSYRLLVTCCHERGGLAEIKIEHNSYKVTMHLQDLDLRGITKYGEQYLIASNKIGLMLVDRDLNVLVNNGFTNKDYHAVLVHEGRAFVVETAINAVGIYELPSLDRIGEIRLDEKDYDVMHINDMVIDNDRLIVSMFTPDGEWRKLNDPFTGSIAEYDLRTGKRLGFRYQGLHRPHNVIPTEEGFFFCNSAEHTVCQDGDVVFQALGFTRGLALHGDMMFIGQSIARHLERIKGALNVSLDCGVHVFHRRLKGCRFIPLPAGDVYNILVDQVELTDRIPMGTFDVDGYLISGFCVAESDEHFSWRWSEGAESVMEICLEPYRPYNLRMTMAPFEVPELVQSVEVSLNKKVVGRAVLNKRGYQEYEFDVPGEIVKARNVLRFAYEYAKSPQEVYGSGDTRVLAVSFHEIVLEELE